MQVAKYFNQLTCQIYNNNFKQTMNFCEAYIVGCKLAWSLFGWTLISCFDTWYFENYFKVESGIFQAGLHLEVFSLHLNID